MRQMVDDRVFIQAPENVAAPVNALLAQGKDHLGLSNACIPDVVGCQNHFTDGGTPQDGNVILVLLGGSEPGGHACET